MSKQINILVIDDEENILKSLKRIFINDTFDVATTTNPDEAMAILSREKIKVVISDHRMPTISGVEFLRRVKEQFPDIVRILFTGYADVSAAEEAINVSQVYRFINKPWNVSELKGVIYQAIQYYDLVRENRKLFQATIAKNEELEIVNRKLKAMYEIQREFSSTISHELRTPLASIKLAIDIVLSGTTGKLSNQQDDFLNKAKLSVDRLKRLIDDILDLSKLEYGKQKLNKQLQDIHRVVNEVIALQEPVAKHKNIYLKTQLSSNLPKIPYDIDRIHQVLNNLISNAIKFTDHGGIEISAVYNEEDRHVEIHIKDTGVGIEEEDIPKLFKKFQQLGDPARRATGGTGLGLAICKEIIEQHGGKIWVNSHYGQGSIFSFILPLEDKNKAANF